MSGPDNSLMDLFRQELQTHCRSLADHLLILERKPDDDEALAELMRAAHSLKGAARIMDFPPLVSLAHGMENIFVACRNGTVQLDVAGIELLLMGIEKFRGLLEVSDDTVREWLAERQSDIDTLVEEYGALATGQKASGTEEDAAGGAPLPADSEMDIPAPDELPETGAGPPMSEQVVEPSPSLKDQSRSPKSYPIDLSAMSMMDLFRQEAEMHCATLTDNLLLLEQDSADGDALAALMRAAHSIKGAARVINLGIIVGLAHAMEDVFVAAQENRIVIRQEDIDELLKGTDIFEEIGATADEQLEEWFASREETILGLELGYRNIAAGGTSKISGRQPVERQDDAVAVEREARKEQAAPVVEETPPLRERKPVAGQVELKDDESDQAADRSLRVSAEGMNRLMGFAGEVQVESRWLPDFAKKILNLKRRQDELYRLLGELGETLDLYDPEDAAGSSFQNIVTRLGLCTNMVQDLLVEAEDHARRSTEISHYLYQEVLANRMRPFLDGVRHFPRMVRDVARELGKKVSFRIVGEETLVDRDILDKIEAPLNHLVRNAVDHGVETPEQRREAGKPETAVISLEARHSAGMLSIVVSDDGRGIDIEELRRTVISRKMISEEAARQLREAELLEFLFLPNFSTRDAVSTVSGRGVGLDVVHSAVHEVRGIIRTSTELGKGTTFELQLPLTLSVMRSLLVEISGEVYAFPLVAIDHVLTLEGEVREIEGRQYVSFGQERIGLVSACQVLGKQDNRDDDRDELLVLIISDRYNRYGLIVDGFLEIRDLVVQPLDRRLQKVRDISSVAILEDGTPVLIVDVEDMVRSIDTLISGNRLRRIGGSDELDPRQRQKRILVVDDSITVREVERKMLSVRGYEVRTAVDGVDGWNTLRGEDFDLVVTDVDMPRMDGIELVSIIRADERYGNLPVIIVSYKDREEDRNRGLEAGADYYLTKGSFQDEALVGTVEELIGPPLEIR